MIGLSDRLRVIADEIEPGETVADIGTDHGLLPIFLHQSGRSPRVVLCDINRGPLNKAEENIVRHLGAGALAENDALEGLTAMSVRLGDGLSPLGCSEVDAVVIAGMGGVLMTEILGADIAKSRSFSKLVLQPRNGSDKLRWWLLHNGFVIVSERLVIERKYICEVLTVRPCSFCEPEDLQRWKSLWQEPLRVLPALTALPAQRQDPQLKLEISPLLFLRKDPLLGEWIQRKIRIEQKVLQQVKEGGGEEHARAGEAQRRLNVLQQLKERQGGNDR